MRLPRIVALSFAILLACGCALAEAGGLSLGAVISGQIIPGVYGRVVLGNRTSRPPLVFGHPLMVEPVPYGAPVPPPVYLYVPPFQSRHWGRYCHEYRACRRPVYFVSSPEYAPGFNLERWRREHPDWDRHRPAVRWVDPGRRAYDGRFRDRRYDARREDHDRRWREQDRRDRRHSWHRGRDRGQARWERRDRRDWRDRHDRRDRRDRRDDDH